jgi:hypothetical protein
MADAARLRIGIGDDATAAIAASRFYRLQDVVVG